MSSEEPKQPPGEPPGSYVDADMGVQLPTERGPASEDETYADRRDHEQLGRPREAMLRKVQETAPPAADDAGALGVQTDQPSRQG